MIRNTATHHITPYHVIPHHSLPYHEKEHRNTSYLTLSCHTTPQHTISWKRTLQHIIPHFSMSYNTRAHCIIKKNTMAHHITLYHVILHHTIPQHSSHTLQNHSLLIHIITNDPQNITPHKTFPWAVAFTSYYGGYYSCDFLLPNADFFFSTALFLITRFPVSPTKTLRTFQIWLFCEHIPTDEFIIRPPHYILKPTGSYWAY